MSASEKAASSNNNWLTQNMINALPNLKSASTPFSKRNLKAIPFENDAAEAAGGAGSAPVPAAAAAAAASPQWICVWDFDDTIYRTVPRPEGHVPIGGEAQPPALNRSGPPTYVVHQKLVPSRISQKALAFLRHIVNLRDMGIVSYIIMLSNNPNYQLIRDAEQYIKTLFRIDHLFDYIITGKSTYRKNENPYNIYKGIDDIAIALMNLPITYDLPEDAEERYINFSETTTPRASELDDFIETNRLAERILFFDDNDTAINLFVHNHQIPLEHYVRFRIVKEHLKTKHDRIDMKIPLDDTLLHERLYYHNDRTQISSSEHDMYYRILGGPSQPILGPAPRASSRRRKYKSRKVGQRRRYRTTRRN